MSGRGPWFLFLAMWLAHGTVLGQGLPLSTLAGRVSSSDGQPLSGAAVRVISSSLQGARETPTGSQGEFVLPFLPPGDYAVSFSAPGMTAISRSVTLPAATTIRIDETLAPAGVAESVVVSGSAAPVEPGIAVSANVPQKLLDQLPYGRTVRDAVLLVPGVNENGPAGTAFTNGLPHAIMISGAMSFENLYLLNGAVINDNYRGDPQNHYIEDAIQETTVETGRISAEYGRFAGGVVNVVTRSGGNNVSGTFRTSFVNAAWSANDAYNRVRGSDYRSSDAHETYEATLGLPLWKDRVWAFAAGRWAELFQNEQTRADFEPGDIDPAPVPYVYGTKERRVEGKLTAAITGSYSLIASYIDSKIDETNWAIDRNILSTDSLISRTLPSLSPLTLSFHGVLTRDAFLEAQYSSRAASATQEGTAHADRVDGSWISTGRGVFGDPQFAGGMPWQFDNQSALLKASYLLSTPRFGSHDIHAGAEWFRESSRIDITFSRSDYVIDADGAILRGTRVFPVFTPGLARIDYWPLAAPPGTTKLATASAFLNDRLQWGARWSFNLGVRYDRNDDRASDGEVVSTASAWSPRLAARFDASGDGRLLVDAGYAQYVAQMHPNPANFASAAGNPAFLQWEYGGECINCDSSRATEELVSQDEALRRVFAWFDSAGGIDLPIVDGGYPGFNRIVSGGLRSPRATEYSIGGTASLGAKGSVAASFIYRSYGNLYDSRIDISTGKSPPDPYGRIHDVAVIGNSKDLKRRYEGVQTQFRYQVTPALAAGGSYTWSRLTGNSIGELSCCTADSGHIHDYPEYKQSSWNSPTGYLTGGGEDPGLSEDQRNRARIWLVWQSPLRLGRMSLALLESYDSGVGYDAVGDIDIQPYVQNPGYEIPPWDVRYYFSPPAAYRTDNISSTNLALDWSVPVYRSAEIFLHVQVTNLFNAQGVMGVDTFVETSLGDEDLEPFDPFHEKPREGVNYRLDSNFGKPGGPDQYQTPRAFQFSVGVRF